jgi:hypothetical protein
MVLNRTMVVGALVLVLALIGAAFAASTSQLLRADVVAGAAVASSDAGTVGPQDNDCCNN